MSSKLYQGITYHGLFRALGPLCRHTDRQVDGAPMATAYVLDYRPARKDSRGRRVRGSDAVPVGPPVALAVGVYRPPVKWGLTDACRLDGGRAFDWQVTLLGRRLRSDAHSVTLR